MRTFDSMPLMSFLRAGSTLAALVLVLMFVAACDSPSKSGDGDGGGGGSGSGATPSRSFSALLGNWELQSLLGEQITESPAISMTIGPDGGMSGRSAVNGYSATLDTRRLASGAIEAYPIASTMMAGTPERMELEARYFSAIERARTWRIDNGALLLHDGEVEVARFHRAAG